MIFYGCLNFGGVFLALKSRFNRLKNTVDCPKSPLAPSPQNDDSRVFQTVKVQNFGGIVVDYYTNG